MDEMILMSSTKFEKLLMQIIEEKIVPLIKTPNEKSLDEILDFKQTRLLLRISKPTLFKRMADGTIPYKKIGRRLLFLKAEILKVVSNQTTNYKKRK